MLGLLQYIDPVDLPFLSEPFGSIGIQQILLLLLGIIIIVSCCVLLCW